MRPTARRRCAGVVATVLATVVVAGLALTACGSDSAGDVDYGSQRVAPLPEDVADAGSDVTPDAEDALVELDLDSGGTAAFWIDPDDISQVFVQYSDPDDASAWTQPALVYEAGDGCLTMSADSAGDTVAVGLGCYEIDAFIQQAPDDGVALVSTDMSTWEQQRLGEAAPSPSVSDDGDEVDFRDAVNGDEVVATWRSGEGFSS